MKKIFFILLLVLFHLGCTSRQSETIEAEEKVYTLSDLKNLYNQKQAITLEGFQGQPIAVGSNQDLKPGIYLVEGMARDVDTQDSWITDWELYVARAKFPGILSSFQFTYPNSVINDAVASSFTLILFEGDTVEFLYGGKASFTPKTLPAQVSKTITQGNYIVGIDIPSGDFSLTTNNLFDEASNLGWDVIICNLIDLNASNTCTSDWYYDYIEFSGQNPNVTITLKEGDILTLALRSWIRQEGMNADQGVVILTP